MKRNFISHFLFGILLFLSMAAGNKAFSTNDPIVTIYPAPPNEILS
jgi:hypothetical protein